VDPRFPPNYEQVYLETLKAVHPKLFSDVLKELELDGGVSNKLLQEFYQGIGE
jgi:hypothetical protein